MEENPFDPRMSGGPAGSRFRFSWKAPLVFGWVAFLVLLCLFVVWHKVTNDQSQLSTQANDQIDAEDITLSDLDPVDDGLASSAKGRTLEVNGQLKVNNSLVFDPGDPPANPERGQVYYDKASNVPMYYDGERFVAVATTDDVAEASRVAVRVNEPDDREVTVDVPADTARTGQANTFTGNNLFMQDLAVSGFTALQSTSIASLVLSQPLAVSSGGTGASSFASGSILIGNGSSALSSVSAGSTGLCLMSTNGAPSFQACPSGGSTPNAVTSTANTSGRLARFGGGNSIVDSLLSDDGSAVSVAGNLRLGANALQLGGGVFGSTLNTTGLSANRSILLPDESGTICLRNSSSCGFVSGTPADFIQNQFSGGQANTNFWISGEGVAGRLTASELHAAYVDGRPGGNDVLAIGASHATRVTLGHYGKSVTSAGQFTAAQGIIVTDLGLTLQGSTASYTTPFGFQLSTMINIPNYTVPDFSSILAFGLPSTSSATARGLLIADARSSSHQPTIGVLSPNESDIFGLSWEGSNGVASLKTLGASVGIRLNTNDVAQFQGSQIYLNQNTNITGGMQVNGNSVFTPTADSTNAFRIQGADTSAVLLRADTIGNKLVVRELEVTYNLVIGGNLTVGGHFRSTGTTPTYSAAPASCTSPTVSVTGNDIAGMLTVVAGTGCGATGEIAAVLFANQFYETLPTVTITAANAVTANLNTFVDSGTMTLGGFDISTTSPLSDGTTYKWYYHVIQ